jgi:hypothetical protein
MNELLKYTRVNVRIKDKETQELLFDGHNLFVETGRAFIAETFKGQISGGVIQPGAFVCDLGDDGTTPVATDIDLYNYNSADELSVGVSPTYPADLAGSPTGIWFRFDFVNNTGIDQTIRELGLFYRPDSDDFPKRGTSPSTMKGTMLARLKTTSSSLVVGNSRTITIDWKIIF